jgi:Zn-dependent protease
MEDHPTSLVTPPADAARVDVADASRRPATDAPAAQSAGPNTWGSPPALGPSPTADPFGRPAPRRRTRSKIRERAGAIGAAIIAVIAKFKAILLILPKIKLLTTGATAIVSVVAYSLFFGWWFALGFVILLFVHEMGHVIALRREGIQASAPMFIPFLGAMISAKSLGDNAVAEARVGLAGPILGSLGAALVAVLAAATGSPFLQALAYTGFLLNLFNLIPVVPFDGGRAMAAMSPKMWLVGLAVMIGLGLATANPFLFFFALLGGLESWRRWKQIRQRSLETAAYYRVTTRQRLAVAGVYVGLMVTLTLAMYATYIPHSVGFSHY